MKRKNRRHRDYTMKFTIPNQTRAGMYITEMFFFFFFFFFLGETSTIGGCFFVGLLFREHPKAQPEGGFRRSPGSNLRPLVYKASDLTTAPRRLHICCNDRMTGKETGTYSMCNCLCTSVFLKQKMFSLTWLYNLNIFIFMIESFMHFIILMNLEH